MTGAAILLVALNRFSNGRRLFVLKAVLKVAKELENEAIIAWTEQALAFEREVRKLERRWRTARGKRSRSRGNAKEIDLQVDRIVSAMLGSLELLLVSLTAGSEEALRVIHYIDKYFPEGAAAITNAEFEDALAIIEEMVEDFAPMPEAELDALNIKTHVAALARLVPQFAAELNRPQKGMRFDTVREARREGHEMLCDLVATILSEYKGKDPDKLEARAALLAPILDANERVTARRKRRNGPDVDVNPNTGEELEPGADIIDDEEDPAGPDPAIVDSDPTPTDEGDAER